MNTETTGHFLRCVKNEQYSTSMDAFTSTLHNKTSKSKSHVFYTFFQDCIEQWLLNGPEIPSMDDPCTPGLSYFGQPPDLQDAISVAIADQTRIGWDNALTGILAYSWIEVAKHCNQPPWEAERRIQTAIKGLHKRTASLWKGRNNQLHGPQEREATRVYTAESATIRYYHSRPHLLGLTDRHYCDKPLISILRGSPATRRRWLMRVRLARADYIKDGRLQTQITGFFPQTAQQLAVSNTNEASTPATIADNTTGNPPPHISRDDVALSEARQANNTKNPQKHSRRQVTAQSMITSFYPSARPPEENTNAPGLGTPTQIPRI